MITISVWVLVAYLSGYNHGGPLAVDNIATLEDCQAAARRIEDLRKEVRVVSVCIPIRKIKE